MTTTTAPTRIRTENTEGLMPATRKRLHRLVAHLRRLARSHHAREAGVTLWERDVPLARVALDSPGVHVLNDIDRDGLEGEVSKRRVRVLVRVPTRFGWTDEADDVSRRLDGLLAQHGDIDHMTEVPRVGSLTPEILETNDQSDGRLYDTRAGALTEGRRGIKGNRTEYPWLLAPGIHLAVPLIVTLLTAGALQLAGIDPTPRSGPGPLDILIMVLSTALGAGIGWVIGQLSRWLRDIGSRSHPRHRSSATMITAWATAGLLASALAQFGALTSPERLAYLAVVAAAVVLVCLVDRWLFVHGYTMPRRIARVATPAALLVGAVHLRSATWADGVGVPTGNLSPPVFNLALGLFHGFTPVAVALCAGFLIWRYCRWLPWPSHLLGLSVASILILPATFSWVSAPYDDARAVVEGADNAPSAPTLVQPVCVKDGGERTTMTYVGETSSSYALLTKDADRARLVPRSTVVLTFGHC